MLLQIIHLLLDQVITWRQTSTFTHTHTQNSYSQHCVNYACGFHSVRQSYVTLEEPQVVDEVAVPRLPTGEAKAQLPGVSAARCRCWCTMCSKQGNSGFVWAEVGGERKGCLPRHFRIDANLTHAWVLPTVYVTIPSSLTDWWKVLLPFFLTCCPLKRVALSLCAAIQTIGVKILSGDPSWMVSWQQAIVAECFWLLSVITFSI